jgi:hypothetical protein
LLEWLEIIPGGGDSAMTGDAGKQSGPDGASTRHNAGCAEVRKEED